MPKEEDFVEEEELDRGDEFYDDEEEDEELEEHEDDEDEEEDADEESDEESDEEEVDEEDDDEEEGDEDEEDDEDDDEGPRIPRSRLNEVIKQREEQKEEVRWLKEQLQLVLATGGKKATEAEVQADEPEFDFDNAEDTYIDLVLDGDKEQARKLRQQIDNERAKSIQKQIAKVSEDASNVATTKAAEFEENQKYTAVLTSALEKYSFLNDKSKAYNATAVKMANRVMQGYLAEGDSKDEALRKAVKDIVPLYDKPASTSKGRDKAARTKAAKAAKQQPTSPSRSTASKGKRDVGTLRVDKMTEKAFNSLTAKEKAALRGD